MNARTSLTLSLRRGFGMKTQKKAPKAPYYEAMTLETLLRWLELAIAGEQGFDGKGALAELRHRLR